MTPAAQRAALETFANIARERQPSLVLLPLGALGVDHGVASPAASPVIWPFATNLHPDATSEQHLSLFAPKSDRRRAS